MRVVIIPTPFFDANCLVIVADGSAEALVVDPSHGVLDRVDAVLAGFGGVVGAVLCTHGHPDHVWDAAAAARRGSAAAEDAQVPVWCPGPDLPRFDDPLSWVPMAPTGMDLVWERPSDVRAMPMGAVELVPGVVLAMVPAPGHTQGSALFVLRSDLTVIDGHTATEVTAPLVQDRRDDAAWALTGDVIFRGSVGRTDLPGGDETQMRHTLRTLATAIDPTTVLIPGHGPLTTMQRELMVNPHLRKARRLG